MEVEYCTRCQMKPEGEFLREIAHPRDRSLQDILRQAQQAEDSWIAQTAGKCADERLELNKQKLEEYERQLKDMEENASFQAMNSILRGDGIDDIAYEMLADEARKDLQHKIGSLRWEPQDIDEQDVKQAIEAYIGEGHIELQGETVKITATGAKRLASHALQRILESLTSKDLGPHSIEETGFGSKLSPYTRDYESGDDYSLVDIESTLMNASARGGPLHLDPADFVIHEEIHQSRLCAGLLIDQSGSMRNRRKMEGALETALALSELIRKEPRDCLKVFVFSEQVNEIPSWAIANQVMGGGFTDISGAMHAFLKAARNEKGDRQAYLITDAEPNVAHGRYVGFEKALAGMMEEAFHYRKHNVGLNIIMLDETPHLMQLASAVARNNLGRVFFTSPLSLGRVVVKHYLRAKKGRR